jgi:tetratricopeptide (TPR) repeat protein
MSYEPIVPLSQRRGTSAEAEAKARLSYFSIVAKPDPDVGIDFYCELLDQKKPSGKFFGVQVKGTKKCGEQPSARVKKSTIHYWTKLAFPVYIIMYDDNDEKCYWASFLQNLYSIGEKILNKSSTVCIGIDKKCVLYRGENTNKDFVSKVKGDIMLLSLLQGRPQLGNGYVRTLPVALLTQQVRTNLAENIRTSMNYLVNHYLLTKDIEKAYLLCDFLTKFDKAHYDHFYKLGCINRQLGNKPEAKRNFEEAIRICRGDKKWNLLKDSSYPTIEEIIEAIEGEIQKLDAS